MEKVDELQIYRIVTAMSGDTVYCYDIANDEMKFYYGSTASTRFGNGTPNYMAHVEKVYMNGPDRDVAQKILMTMKTGTPGFFEYVMTLCTESGTPQKCKIAGRCLYDDHNDPAYIVGTIHEIKERQSGAEEAEDGYSRDVVTGAYNRSSFKHKLETFVDTDEDVIRGYLLFAIDDLRENCNQMTHVENSVLTNVVQTVKRIYPYNVFVGRVRYDEIGVFYTGNDIENEFLAKIDALDRAIMQIEVSGTKRPISISGGIYFDNVKDVSSYDFRDRVRVAQIAATNRGKGRIVPYRPELEAIYNSRFNLEAEYNDTRFDYQLIEEAMELMATFGNAEDSLNELLRKIGMMYNLDRITVRSIDDQTHSMNILARWVDVHSSTAVNAPTLASYELVQEMQSRMEDSYVDQEHGAVICYYVGTFKDQGVVDFRAREKNRIWSEREIRTFKLLTKLTSGYLLNMSAYMKLLRDGEKAKTHDLVTGFAKYEAFVTEAAAYVKEHPEKQLAILYTGMKDFMAVNDRYGREVGDEVLKGYAEELMATEDRVVLGCRRNADNFVALINRFDQRGNQISAAMIDRMSQSFQSKFAQKCEGVNLAINAGVVFLPAEVENLYEYIDRAMTARERARADDNISCILA